MNISNAWNLEFEDGTVMNLDKAEHIKEAAAVVSQYADIIAVRAFPSLNDKAKMRPSMSFRHLLSMPLYLLLIWKVPRPTLCNL